MNVRNLQQMCHKCYQVNHLNMCALSGVFFFFFLQVHQQISLKLSGVESKKSAQMLPNDPLEHVYVTLRSKINTVLSLLFLQVHDHRSL